MRRIPKEKGRRLAGEFFVVVGVFFAAPCYIRLETGVNLRGKNKCQICGDRRGGKKEIVKSTDASRETNLAV